MNGQVIHHRAEQSIRPLEHIPKINSLVVFCAEKELFAELSFLVDTNVPCKSSNGSVVADTMADKMADRRSKGNGMTIMFLMEL